MKIKLLLFIGFILSGLSALAQSVVVNKIYNNTNSAAGGSVNGQGDGVEFLVLEDHTDLRGAYFKDFYNMNASSTEFVEGSQWQLSNDAIWSDLRTGTTLVFIRPPLSSVPAPDLIIDKENFKIQVPLSDVGSQYVNQITDNNNYTFNVQGRDGVVLKRGSSPNGFDNLIHFCFTGYASVTSSLIDAYNAVEGPKMALQDILPGTTSSGGTSGYLFAKNPTAESSPEDALIDYNGIDDSPSNILGWWLANDRTYWGVGEPNSTSTFNEKFVDYLRASPKIESIAPVTTSANSATVVFTVTFDKDVSTVSADDFEIQATGSALGNIVSVNGSGKIYQFTVEVSGIGNVKLVKKAVTTNIVAGTLKIFNGFVDERSASHQVNRQIVLEKPQAPQVDGSVNGISEDLTPTVSGIAVANSKINLYMDGVKLGATIASNADGAWSYTFSSPITATNHEFYITVTLANVTSEASDEVATNFINYIVTKPQQRAVVVNKVFNSGSAAGDVVELLVLDDHVDIGGLYIKDQLGNNSTSTEYNDNGGKYQFKDIPLWRNLRSGTTIVIRRSPTAYTPDIDRSDSTIDVSLDDSDYFTSIGGSFNIQNYDMVVLKGGTSESGYDELVHAFISGVNDNTKNAFNNFPEPKMGINALTPSTNGFLYANNPTAISAPHSGLVDYAGFVDTDKPGVVAAGTQVVYNPEPPIIKTTFNGVDPNYHVGEGPNGKLFIDYLRAAPKIESIVPAVSGGKGNSVVFYLLFNKDVSGVDLNDFRLLATNTADGTLASISGSGRDYQIIVNNLSGDGDISIVKKAYGTQVSDGANLFFEGFEYLKSNPYHVDDLPVVIQKPAAPQVVGSINGINYNFSPLITGTVRANAGVNLFIDDVKVGASIQSNNTGEWSYQVPDLLALGTHTFKISISGVFGTSELSDVTTVLFDIKVPEQPVVNAAVNGVTNSFRPIISGEAEPNVQINLFIDGVVLNKLIYTDADGKWSFHILEALNPGMHTFAVSSTTNVGTSAKSAQAEVLFKLFTGEISVNNILTPNGDGKNDIWLISNLDMYPKNEVMVYDKKGNIVFKQQNYQQNWGGTTDNGQQAESGTYYYHITFGPDLPALKGYLTILKSN